ncbi:MAG: phosphotransferase family protein [Xanthomonadales bacterium]|nr:phosphotransferase family protein [Xanthomonadales bacterium]
MKAREQIQPVEGALLRWLQQHVDGFRGPARLEKFKGGQSNPTFKLSAASGTYVLRRQPSGKLLKSAHAVDREFRVMMALTDSEVPVPKVHGLCESRDVIGSMFYVMEFCDGRIFWDASLPELGSNEERSALYDEMNRVLAAMHNIDPVTVGLADYGKPGNYFARQLTRWTSQYRASELAPIPAMEDLMAWLDSNQPADDGRVALVHGDYRLDNLVFHPQHARIIAVLDWELSTLGHPLADLAYQCMQLRMPAEKGFAPGLRGVDRASLGIPSESEYVARYCERTGITGIENWTFCLAFSFFRLAAIVQGVAKRAVDGNASNTRAAELGRWVEPLAEMALHVINEQA